MDDNQYLAKVEVFNRPFCVQWDDSDTEVNINYAPHGITAENFIEGAVYQTEYEFGQSLVLGFNTIGNRVWYDLNQNGIDDNGDESTADAPLVIWFVIQRVKSFGAEIWCWGSRSLRAEVRHSLSACVEPATIKLTSDQS